MTARLATGHFPPKPTALRGRRHELRTLEQTIQAAHPTRLALVGAGGSGKSTLAAALGHRLRSRFRGRVEWFRTGAFGATTLFKMLALRFALSGDDPRTMVRRYLERKDRLIVLDNHEDDEAVAELLDVLRLTAVTWVITARRCLLGGVNIFPVTAPLATRRQAPFAAVASLTSLLRWNPLALSIADALVRNGQTSAQTLDRALRRKGIDRVSVIADEDDLPEVRLLVDWIWPQLGAPHRRALAVLAHTGGDHMDGGSIAALARVSRIGPVLTRLLALGLIQEPLAGRFALHATMRRAIRPRTEIDSAALFGHYVSMLEQHPERLEAEQTHLFAAMDYAQDADLAARLRVSRLLASLGL